MSVWKRFQRVGKKAAKFQFTASYTELVIETNSFKPSNIVITWLRRNRKYHSEPIKLSEVKLTSCKYSHVWEVPHNEEIVTTLYRVRRDSELEEKDWTFQLEDVGDNGTRRRLLAYRNINMAQYADVLPTQNTIKVVFKISSKKIQSATLFLTLSGVFLKEGEATDDDMISVASLMSLPSNQNFSIQSSDIARLSDFDDMGVEASNNINEKFNDLFDKIGNLECESWNVDEPPAPKTEKISPERKDKSPVKETSPDQISTSASIPRPRMNRDDAEDEDRLSNIAEEDRSPSSEPTSDLLDWCRFITAGYKNVSITNSTTSFRNGIAFCAIIHHFHPSLIDIESLRPADVKENNRKAFSAAASLGIPKVLDPNEMNFLKVPDALSVMTYLHQLRTHFTDCNLVLTPASCGGDHQPGYTVQASMGTLLISPGDVETVSYAEVQARVGGDGAIKEHTMSSANTDFRTPTVLDTKTDAEAPPKKKSPKKAKMKLSSLNVDGTAKEGSSWSERKVKQVNVGRLKLLSEHENKAHDDDTMGAFSPLSTNGLSSKSPSHTTTPSIVASAETSAADSGSYILAETAALQREQDKIDEEACRLEPQLRLAMHKDRQQESLLLRQWFVIVNKKNALIRRNMQLQILDKEQNLERKWGLLLEELRQINAIEDWNKSEGTRDREELLMKDLVNIIEQRDKVVRDLDQYEKSMATDIEWAKKHPEMITPRNKNAFSMNLVASGKFSDKNCTIQ